MTYRLAIRHHGLVQLFLHDSRFLGEKAGCSVHLIMSDPIFELRGRDGAFEYNDTVLIIDVTEWVATIESEHSVVNQIIAIRNRSAVRLHHALYFEVPYQIVAVVCPHDLA
jgi:hypothetical protein